MHSLKKSLSTLLHQALHLLFSLSYKKYSLNVLLAAFLSSKTKNVSTDSYTRSNEFYVNKFTKYNKFKFSLRKIVLNLKSTTLTQQQNSLVCHAGFTTW